MASAWETPQPNIAKSIWNGVVLSTSDIKTRAGLGARVYRGISLTRKHLLLGRYSRPVRRSLWWSYGSAVSYERDTLVGCRVLDRERLA